MKKQCVIALLVVSTLISSSAFAGLSYHFEDKIDTWTPLALDAVPIVEGTPFTFTHDLRDDVDFAAGHRVVEAWLELDFTNDLTDSYGSAWGGRIRWDSREYVRFSYDGSTPGENLGEVDNGAYTRPISLDWLNDDGRLEVTLNVYNSLDSAIATAWLDHARLYGTAVVPAPAGVLLGLLGFATAGLRLRRRK